MPQSISSRLWKPLAVILVFIVASGLTRVIMGSDEPQLSSRQQAVLDGLRERTGELVVQYADIKSLPGDWYDCTKPEQDDYTVIYQWDDDGNVTDVKAGVTVNIGRADSDFCEQEAGGWVGSALALSADRQRVLDLNAAFRDLSRGTEGQLQKLVALVAEEYGYGGEPYGGSWLSAPLGDSEYSLEFHALDPDRDIDYTYYAFVFNRNIVLASLAVRVPTSMADDDDAVAVARAFDERIQTAIESVSREGE